MPPSPVPWRPFEFARDTFAFANELLWEYLPDPATGQMSFRRRDPRPAYAHRCFVLTRATRSFHYHAVFEPGEPVVGDAEYRGLVRSVLRRSPRRPSPPEHRVRIPGFANVREFSAGKEPLLKAVCGGAWQSYLLRSHWRMVFPISRRHQETTAQRIAAAIANGDVPVLHLVRFPQLTINHGVVAFARSSRGSDLKFGVYDPNAPAGPARLEYDAAARTFLFPPTRYWAGGPLDVIEIFRGWFL